MNRFEVLRRLIEVGFTFDFKLVRNEIIVGRFSNRVIIDEYAYEKALRGYYRNDMSIYCYLCKFREDYRCNLISSKDIHRYAGTCRYGFIFLNTKEDMNLFLKSILAKYNEQV